LSKSQRFRLVQFRENRTRRQTLRSPFNHARYDQLNRVLWGNGKDSNENLLWAQNFSYDRYGNQWMHSTGDLQP